MLSLCVSTSFTLWHNIVDKNDTIDKLDEAISLVKPATDLTNETLIGLLDATMPSYRLAYTYYLSLSLEW